MNLTKLNGIFLNLGLGQGDIVLVASDIRRILIASRQKGVMISPADIIDMLQKIVGPEGTLLFPVYNWDFCSGKRFDYIQSPGKTGTLGNTALHMNSFYRTKHPIYSFAVWGKYSEYLCRLTNSDSFALDSPFAFLHQHQAKMLLLDVICQNSLTFVHYVEQAHTVPYRFLKTFAAEYTDKDGTTFKRECSMFVRKLDQGIITDLTGLEKLLIQKRNLRFVYDTPSHFGCITNLATTYEIIANDIEQNAAKNLYTSTLDR